MSKIDLIREYKRECREEILKVKEEYMEKLNKAADKLFAESEDYIPEGMDNNIM